MFFTIKGKLEKKLQRWVLIIFFLHYLIQFHCNQDWTPKKGIYLPLLICGGQSILYSTTMYHHNIMIFQVKSHKFNSILPLKVYIYQKDFCLETAIIDKRKNVFY